MFERFFYNDDATLVDRTIEWSNPYSSTGAWDAKSYLYISSFLPFNHRYFDVATANDKAGTLSIDVWYNSAWTSVVDIVDKTRTSGISLAQSGNIYFTIDKLKAWEQEDESSDITELSTTNIYNAYWMRIGYDASVDSATVINYIGYKFCEDIDLYTYYPLFNNSGLKTQFKSGKTDWNDQTISASMAIVSDLKSRELIVSKNQLMDSSRYLSACVHKTAEIIYAGLGTAYRDDRIDATKQYTEAINACNFNIDTNGDGKLSRVEKVGTKMSRMSR